ncbi:hypothetical protein CYFUS_002008 [Cystobacter fuscus]|uniref:Uncharacterized protein n=1 Tax=Cystobacter fuscus TaxID=43 RepID=A0A250IZ65_9BACT|nr:hypothetical protein [Cystobacter fuscus]ATB36593.1 hypothetical protein CYFUS_002008 [Cystobacter fuscus]
MYDAAEGSRTRTTDSQAPERCFLVEQAPTRDPRWLQGMSLVIEEALLAEYHPAECARPGERCAIDYYQVKWTTWTQEIWSEPYLPGLNDLDGKPHYDGTRRRKWSYFYDHTHRYRYCARSAAEGASPNKPGRPAVRFSEAERAVPPDES